MYLRWRFLHWNLVAFGFADSNPLQPGALKFIYKPARRSTRRPSEVKIKEKMTCRGVNRFGQRCGTRYNLDGEGYCGWHNPNAVKCRGIAKHGEQCKIAVGLNSRGYCRYHKNQDTSATFMGVSYPHQCPGMASSTGSRCLKDWEICSNGYCVYHQSQVPSRCKPSQQSHEYMERFRAGLFAQDEHRTARRGFRYLKCVGKAGPLSSGESKRGL
ncbi:hypothetical protein PF011_g27305 [Phytophthora fragariae]|uniref:Secreted protein n=1 Tax=Phytophthora fragariae TaxID=53985 RepID=A0A6A3HHT7_9STRA|nr:hypothetical protein PF011_g27305 [Phytophthora fragariae]